MDNQRSLPHLRGLDGLRALAVVAVLVFHADSRWLPGGFLGVDLFFAISGFLITAGLLQEWRTGGSIDLPRFWLRRARRLLPAALTLILATLAITAAFYPQELHRLRGDALASFAYVTNWYLVLHQVPYFETFERPSPLQHLWSLAVEEQFYIVWPLLLAAGLRWLKWPVLVVLVLTLAIASVTWMALLHADGAGVPRLYFATDTRAAGLLFGAALGLVWSPWRREGSPRLLQRLLRNFQSWTLDIAAISAFAGLVWLLLRLGEFDSYLYEGGFALVAAFSAVLIAAVAYPGTLAGKALGIAPLRWLGVRSYAIYLWHWPVFVFSRPGQDVALDGLALQAVRLALILLLAALSYELIEKPARNGMLGHVWGAICGRGISGRRRAAALLGSSTLLMALGVLAGLMVVAPAKPVPAYLAVSSFRGVIADVTAAAEPGVVADSSVPEAAAPEPPPAVIEAAPPPAVARAERSPQSELSASSDVRSVLQPAVEEPMLPLPPPAAHLDARLTAIGDSVLLGAARELARVFGSVDLDAAVARQVAPTIELLRQRATEGTLGPLVLVHTGNNGAFTTRQLDEIMSVLAGKQVLIVNLHVPRPWEAPNNAMLDAHVAQYPNATLVDWNAVSTGRPELFVEDGVHLTAAGARVFVDLVAQYAVD